MQILKYSYMDIKKYNLNIIYIEIISDIISITINKKNYISFNEIIKKENSENIIEFIYEILKKNYIKEKNIDLIVLNYCIYNYTNSKIISIIIQSLSLTFKIPIIKITNSYDLAISISRINKKKYIIINNNINQTYLNQEIYINNYKKTKLILKNSLKKIKNSNSLKKNNNTIIKNIKIYKNKKIIPGIYTFLFMCKNQVLNKFELPNKIIPPYINKNSYSYYYN